jgi:hypothetical protein
MTLAIAGIVAGFIHVLSGPDHLAAIAPYAVDGRSRAWRTGVRWGLGHSTGVLGVGLLLLLLRDALPLDAVSAWSERLVGVVLLAIGIWGIHAALNREHAHPHVHGKHGYGRAAFAVGTLHGFAGSSHLLGVLPVLALPSTRTAAIYLLLFGVGSVAAMGTFASIVGWFARRRGAGAPRTQRRLMTLASLCAIVVGSAWILTAP